MENKQTAVDWLLDNIYLLNSIKWNEVIINQAKQMEKEQIINAYDKGFSNPKNAEQYYNETYAK